MTQIKAITFVPATPQSVRYSIIRSDRRGGEDYASINLAASGVTVAMPLTWFYELVGSIRVMDQEHVRNEELELKGDA